MKIVIAAMVLVSVVAASAASQDKSKRVYENATKIGSAKPVKR